MNTQELNQRLERQRAELATIDEDLKSGRASLRANNSTDAARQIAASVLVLEARKTATQANIEQTQQQIDTLTVLVNSREYKNAHKRMSEIESELQQCERTANELLQQMRDNNTRADALQSENAELIRKYCIELDNVAKSNRIKNKSYGFTAWVARLIAPVFAARVYREALQRQGIAV